MNHIFTSDRLGFRNYREDDLESMFAVSGDPEVMEHFPFTNTKEQTQGFIARMMKHFDEHQFCYFAVDRLDTMEMIGFIGLYTQDYLEGKEPFVDIGWRLAKSSWGVGFATEGSKACLQYAFDKLGMDTIYSVASTINVKSLRVMEKIGMEAEHEFKHPLLLSHPRIVNCIRYRIDKK